MKRMLHTLLPCFIQSDILAIGSTSPRAWCLSHGRMGKRAGCYWYPPAADPRIYPLNTTTTWRESGKAGPGIAMILSVSLSACSVMSILKVTSKHTTIHSMYLQ